MDSTIPRRAATTRTPADRRMRRFLRLSEDAPPVSLVDAQNAFSKSIFISAMRCLITYVALPLLAPIADLSGSFGPILGLVLGAVSMTAIVFSTRRFFAADHRWRWRYTAIGGAIFVLLIVGAIFDIASLAT